MSQGLTEKMNAGRKYEYIHLLDLQNSITAFLSF